MKNGYQKGLLAGAIAGFVDNTVSILSIVMAWIIGLWEATSWEISYFIDVFLSHLSLNIIWGMFFGVIFVMIYDRIPGRGIKKGLIFGLLFYWVLSNVRIGSFLQSYGDLWYGFDWAVAFIWGGFFPSIAYGLVLGYLYRKPTK
jgi:hypothetical protein